MTRHAKDGLDPLRKASIDAYIVSLDIPPPRLELPLWIWAAATALSCAIGYGLVQMAGWLL